LGINNAGVVVGVTLGVTGTGDAVEWTGTNPTATVLGRGYARAINDAGVVAGYSSGGAVVWHDTVPTFLKGPPGTAATAINNAGVVVGVTGTGDAAKWTSTNAYPTVLNGPGAANLAWAINDAGVVAGFSQSGRGLCLVSCAVIWNGTTPTILNGLGDINVATGINDLGQVVG
jgi:hypothetical protein